MKKDRWFEKGIKLNEDQKENLVGILTKGCRENTKRRITSLINYNLDLVIDWCPMRRFYINCDDKIEYCAGQSYPDEIRNIRNDIMRRFK